MKLTLHLEMTVCVRESCIASLQAKSLPLSFLPVYYQQMGPYIGALGEGFVPGGQQIGITDQPVTAASEAQPTSRADGWMCVLEGQQEMVRI